MRSSLAHLLDFAHRRAAWLLSMAMLIWLGGTHLPSDKIEIGPILAIDKLVHIAGYTILGLLTSAVRMRYRPLSRRSMLVGVGLLMLLAALDEATQPLPGINRSGDVADWVADLMGAMLGAYLYRLARKDGFVEQLVIGSRCPEVS